MGNPVAIVTGAGSGIGRAVCARLARVPYRIALVGRTAASLEETAGELDGAETLVVPVDLSTATAAAPVVAAVVERWGRVDVLVNNAGCAPREPIDTTTAATLDYAFGVNAFGPAGLIAAVWPIFHRQGSGCLVNVTTMGVLDPFPGLFAYAAAKSALDSMTRSAHNEGAGFGVRAFSVAPGAVETKLLREAFPVNELPEAATLDPDAVAQVVCDCILGRREADRGRTVTVQLS
jgi:meso-butanediol dehydrogenase/(S,S)-butanediol dehydrogenase/diacetyl reductase